MGTRSTTTIIEKRKDKEIPLVKLYIQFDGCPEGVGKTLAEFSKDMEIINGISSQKAGEAANGAGCFAAQLIKELKGNDIGSVYVIPITQGGEEYNYEIIVEEWQPVKIRLKEENFDGTAKEFYEKYSSKVTN